MAEAGASAALVRLPDEGLGIVTDSDLRDRVVAGGVSADAPVTEVMSAPAFTVSPQRFARRGDARDARPRHPPRAGGLAPRRGSRRAERPGPAGGRNTERRSRCGASIDDAKDVDQLRRASAMLRPAVISLHEGQVTPSQIAAIIAVVADALIRRLVELTVGELGAPP